MTGQKDSPPIEIEHATMTIGGERYLLIPALIEGTHLGYEDHGIFTAWLTLDYGGGSQGAGMMCLDRPASREADGDRRREGTAYGLDWLIRALETVGVSTWEEVRGKRVYALKPVGREWDLVRGLASIDRPRERLFLFKPHAAAWKEREP
jgi:hypothetical protein